MITIEKSKKIFWVVIGVFILILLASSVGIFTARNNTPQIKREEFIEKIPYYQKEFTITYSKDKDQIYVNVLLEPYEENRQNAEKWIKDNGQNPKNLTLFYTPENIFTELNKP